MPNSDGVVVLVYADVFRQLVRSSKADTIRVLFVCKAGKHRSVASAIQLHKFLQREGVRVNVNHRTVKRS